MPRDLAEYKRKRDFSRTPEPPPVKKKAGGKPLYFCVQKHLASHLHYDFRLEHDGVLLSWAVPKGPSLNPRDKRLAMQTEDHPFDYGEFEGVIPEGYGAGIVLLWDRGAWEPEPGFEDVSAALKKGELKLTLNGFKLKGSWVLVRTRGWGGRGSTRDSSRSWLLIKHRDEWAGELDIVEAAPLSIKTERDFADVLAAENPDVWESHRPAKGGATGAMFSKIIRQAVALREGQDKPAAPATRPAAKPKKAKVARKAAKKKK